MARHHRNEDAITTIAETLRVGRALLADAGIVSPGLDAEVLLRHVLGIDRTTLFARLRVGVNPTILAAYQASLAQRARGIPVAYITGEREFMGVPFAVTPGVLVPRPETEILVEWAIGWLRDRARAIVVDVGTGSGAIALSAAVGARAHWRGRVIAADISSIAIANAAGNRDRLGIGSQVALVRGSLVSWLRGPVDLLLANLPYLRPDQIAANADLSAEPRLALDGGQDGLDLIRRLLLDAPRVLSPGGAIGLEIDPAQRDVVMDLADQAFPRADRSVLRDLAGFDRHIIVQTHGARMDG